MFISLHIAYNSPTRPVIIRIFETRMKNTQQQADYWDRAAAQKIFTHPLQLEPFSRLVNRQARILDYGCGYGRTCNELNQQGYTDLIGVDISAAMIARGRSLYPQLDLRHIPELNLPFAGQSFDACLLFAVLNCVPADRDQITLIDELHRLLRPGGVLYLSDYLVQTDPRNRERYVRYQEKYDRYGIFEVDEGSAVMRHHDLPWLATLLSAFETIREELIEVTTMNGNPALAIQIMAGKKPLTGKNP